MWITMLITNNSTLCLSSKINKKNKKKDNIYLLIMFIFIMYFKLLNIGNYYWKLEIKEKVL